MKQLAVLKLDYLFHLQIIEECRLNCGKIFAGREECVVTSRNKNLCPVVDFYKWGDFSGPQEHYLLLSFIYILNYQ